MATPPLLLKCGWHFENSFFLSQGPGSAGGSIGMSPNTTLSPGFAPSGTSTNFTSEWSALEAHSTIPLLGNPASFLGFRLATTSTCRSGRKLSHFYLAPLWAGGWAQPETGTVAAIDPTTLTSGAKTPRPGISDSTP
ncbi:unnamed protein product [Prorocentrum cordatum]|uniref:Phospholipase B-like n=1 Tax=Prorocentrum cordatum TaxID=2364126 RepID=A0ABN9PM00_9DINO|nr:unnamed protein product [Polarella glacialis]CAK0839788.1 unnamed protein product [Polarella glacialis]